MERHELAELHCITPISNVGSIVAEGLLSHNRVAARRVRHIDVSNQVVQDRRSGRQVPDVRLQRPRPLHDYANVYLCARNAMLFALQPRYSELCVLRIDTAALDLDGAIIADGNASSDYTLFHSSPAGLQFIDRAVTFAQYWIHDDYYAQLDHKRRMCAELLVPDRIPPELIVGSYVSCDAARRTCASNGHPWAASVNPNLFFNR